jgi:nucleoside-diphosphate-sugar epimerase
MVNRILAAGGVAPVMRSVPASAAYLAGWLCEVLYGVLRRLDEPPMTRFVSRELSTAHWFDLTAAKRDLDFEPRVSLDEGLLRLEAWLRGAGQAAAVRNP